MATVAEQQSSQTLLILGCWQWAATETEGGWGAYMTDAMGERVEASSCEWRRTCARTERDSVKLHCAIDCRSNAAPVPVGREELRRVSRSGSLERCSGNVEGCVWLKRVLQSHVRDEKVQCVDISYWATPALFIVSPHPKLIFYMSY